LDALLAGEEPPAPPQKPKPELPAWAKSDALAPNPDKPGFTVSGDPTHGSDDAPLVIVEFTDYQCPACAKHYLEVQPTVEKELIDTGKVRWVSKHLPLPEHKNSIAAAAIECAALQGSITQMKTNLFGQQSEWSSLDNPDQKFLELARSTTLNSKEFAECLNSRESLEGVLNDVFEATSLTRSTPVFVVLDGVSGTSIRGTRSAEMFVVTVVNKLTELLKREEKSSTALSQK